MVCCSEHVRGAIAPYISGKNYLVRLEVSSKLGSISLPYSAALACISAQYKNSTSGTFGGLSRAWASSAPWLAGASQQIRKLRDKLLRTSI